MHNEYIITHFLHPIESPICISEKLGLYFDNLRGEEAEELEKFIEVSMSQEYALDNMNHKMRIPLTAPEEIMSVESGIKSFKKRSNDNQFIKGFLEDNFQSTEDYYKGLSKMWVVLRFNKNPKIYDEFSDRELKSWLATETELPLREHALNYAYILSLLNSEGYEDWYGDSFLLPQLDFFLMHPEPNAHLNGAILFFSGNQYMEVHHKKLVEDLYSFENQIEVYQKLGKEMDGVLDKKSAQKLLYAGNILKITDNKDIDGKLKFTSLVSIIEMILTHNPNFNRFNVEDSISKQFKLKTIVLAFLQDKNSNLEEIKNDLKEIYNQRSNIAHGNFSTFQKFIEKGIKMDGYTPEVILWELTGKLYNYVRIVLRQYILNRDFVEFLKEN